MINFLKRTWSEINLDAIEHNFLQIKNMIKSTCKIMSVVKADAYGHGAEMVARRLDKMGTDWFAVSNLEEALQLRQCGIKKPILILGYTPPEHIAAVVYNDFTQTIFSEEYAFLLSEEALKLNLTVKVHIKIDTGMSRLGFVYQDKIKDNEIVEDIINTCNIKNFNIDGIYTHFSCADMPGEDDFTLQQYNLFSDLIKKLEKRGINFNIKHCSNSAATLRFKEMNLDMVRPGIILYGLYPSEDLKGIGSFIPAMQLKSVVSMLKNIDENVSVSYGKTFTTKNKTKLATVPIGYADGYPRLMSNKGEMIVKGQKVKVVGRVCMDQTVVDVTNVDKIKEDDIITVFGVDNKESISAEEISEVSGTINYETVCLIGKRVPRVYFRKNKIIDTLNYFDA